MKGNQIDDLFRKKLAHQKLNPPPAAWSSLEQHLPTRKKKGAYFLISIAASLLLIFTAGWLFICRNADVISPQTQAQVEELETDDAPAKVKKNITLEKSGEEKQGVSRAIQKKIAKSAVADLVAGNKADLVAKNKADLVAGNKADLVAGNKADLVAGNKTDLVAGNKAGLVAGNKAGLVAGSKADPVAKNKKDTPKFTGQKTKDKVPVAQSPIRLSIAAIQPIATNQRQASLMSTKRANFDIVMPMDISAYYATQNEDFKLARRKKKFRVIITDLSKLSFSELRKAKNNFVEYGLKYGKRPDENSDGED